MSTLDLLLGMLHDSLDQKLVGLFETHEGIGANDLILDINAEIFLLIRFNSSIGVVNFISFFVFLLLPLKEAFLGILECSGEAIENITSVSAVVLVQPLFEKSVQELVRNSAWKRVSVDFRRAIVSEVNSFSGFLDLLGFSISLLLKFLLDGSSELFRLFFLG